jgi:hypothetical protein
MKSLLQRIVTVPFLNSLLIGLFASQIFALPLLADEFANISDIKGCRAITGDTERLACYDTIIDGGIFNEQILKQVQVESFGSSSLRKEKPPAAPAPATETGTATAAGTGTAAAGTGTVSKAPAAAIDTSADELSVTITRVKKDGSGIHYFQTSDGQVWKQRNASAWSLKVPFEAEIKKGLMSSFFLVNEGGKSTRVKRVK